MKKCLEFCLCLLRFFTHWKIIFKPFASVGDTLCNHRSVVFTEGNILLNTTCRAACLGTQPPKMGFRCRSESTKYAVTVIQKREIHSFLINGKLLPCPEPVLCKLLFYFPMCLAEAQGFRLPETTFFFIPANNYRSICRCRKHFNM